MKLALVCLHGWGGSKESFAELRAALAGADVEIFTPDLPGFGAEPEPSKAWTVDDYVAWTEAYLRDVVHIADRPYVLLGHSHGGRISLKLCAAKRVPLPQELILCASAGIRSRRHFKRIAGLLLAKCGKTLLRVPGLKLLQPLAKKCLYRLVRVHDYERASPLMQQTLINVSREDLRPVLAHVSVPTTIFWGANDGMTPLADGEYMHAHIPGSTLTVFPGIRHAVHRDKAEEIAAYVRKRHLG